jgi:hypothetical protein
MCEEAVKENGWILPQDACYREFLVVAAILMICFQCQQIQDRLSRLHFSSPCIDSRCFQGKGGICSWIKISGLSMNKDSTK